MKKILFASLIIATSLFFAPKVLAAEQIDNFAVKIKVNQDASINVSEKIEYDFGDAQKHGIYRYIPIKYKARGGNFNLRISDMSVTDETGSTLTTEITYPGDNVNFKIGDADILITGKHTYVINYTIQRAINYFNDHDELYWNATGNEWSVPILKSSAEIILPASLSADKLQKACYSGPYGSQANCTSSDFVLTSDKTVTNTLFKQDQLNENEGLTIVLGWPKGIVYQPSIWEVIWETIKDNWILFLPIIAFILLFWRWYTQGRDAQGRKTIIAEFDAPDKMIPAEVGTLLDEKADNKDISAELIYLATKGFLKITHENGDYTLDKLKPDTELTNDFDKELIKSIFGEIARKKLSDLEDKFYKDLAKLKLKLYTDLTTKGYFKSNPNTVRGAYLGVGIAIIFFTFFIGGIFGGLAMFSFIVCGAMIAAFGFHMPARTQKGVLAKEHILGLKLYLTVAEKDRINFHNAPAKNPQHFEELLPYAMVLGVEKEWAKQFEGIYNTKPDWYNDPTATNFTALMLVSNMNSFGSEVRSTFASAPASASSGSSGFGGGGGSGGGGGGGGGGSW